MYFCGPPRSGKTQKLVDRYITLVQQGVDVESILVLSSNAYRKRQFLQFVKDRLSGGYPNFNVYTFHGVVYNTVKDFWPLIEARLDGVPQVLPHLAGLETCEFLLKECIKEQNAKNKIDLTFEDFYGNRSLITQLIRRYRLMSENLLSFEKITARSHAIGQKFVIPANEALKCLRIKASKIRVLDFVTQMNAFNFLIKSESQVKQHFSKIKYLLVDDFDEMTPACQAFIKSLLPGVEDLWLTYDECGGTRRGYLSAYPDGLKEVVELSASQVKKMPSDAPLQNIAENLFGAIKSRTPAILEHLTLDNKVNRVEMLEKLTALLDSLFFEKQMSAEDITIVTPSPDAAIRATIQEYCEKNGIPWQFLTGSNKPIDNPKVYGAITVVQLVNTHWKLIPAPFDIRLMLTGIINMPPLIADKVAMEYEKSYRDNPSLPNMLITDLEEEYYDNYRNLIELIETFKKEEIPLYDQFIKIFASIIAPCIAEDESVEDFNKILDSLKDFLCLMEKYNANLNINVTERDWLLQVKNEHVAENPVTPSDVKLGALVVATPQKIVDIELASKYQIWLDVSSTGWTRTQTAPLYNAWAYSGYFDGTPYDDELFTSTITAHVLRSLIYYCNEQVIVLASNLDSSGREQQGWLIKYLANTKQSIVPQYQPGLRDDQAPILDYTGGTMAVAAVPGSGKTFVNVALIVKLIETGVNPENILILTYMDSAAQTIIKRIKSIFPDLNILPYISTIHGLAYKIIRDDDNLAKLGLPEDIDVADDIVRDDIINQITSETLPEFEEFNRWRKHIISAISLAKGLRLKPSNIFNYLRNKDSQLLKEFYLPYKKYSNELEQRGLIDFDDQIWYAIDLLSNFSEVRKKYQQQYKYIIEDEAQDSTKLQQKLLSLLIEGHKNYVRTGDVNQAIMTTFTPVDVEGFRQFIKQADRIVEMDHSQRCAEPIYTLANELIDRSKEIPELNNAFLDIKMKPVEGRNPEVKEKVDIQIFDDSEAEMESAVKNITRLRQLLPGASIAILTRSNPDALNWTEYLDARGFNCICFTDNINQKKVFNLIYSYLKVIHKPYNNIYIRDLYESMIANDILKRDPRVDDFIKNVHSPFMTFEINELPGVKLVQMYMDILYWLEYASMPPSDLILKLAREIFDDPVDRSNGYILSIAAEKYRRDETKIRYKEDFNRLFDKTHDTERLKPIVGLPETIAYFDSLVKARKVKGFKFLEKDDEDETRAGFIQIMTVHKAKGMGFDIVIVPHVWENSYSYPSMLENAVVQSHDKLEVELRKLAGESIDCDEIENKEKLNQIEENMRLLYVAITRAKRYLFLSSSRKESRQGYKRVKQPSRILEYFISKFILKNENLAGMN